MDRPLFSRKEEGITGKTMSSKGEKKKKKRIRDQMTDEKTNIAPSIKFSIGTGDKDRKAEKKKKIKLKFSNASIKKSSTTEKSEQSTERPSSTPLASLSLSVSDSSPSRKSDQIRLKTKKRRKLDAPKKEANRTESSLAFTKPSSELSHQGSATKRNPSQEIKHSNLNKNKEVTERNDFPEEKEGPKKLKLRKSEPSGADRAKPKLTLRLGGSKTSTTTKVTQGNDSDLSPKTNSMGVTIPDRPNSVNATKTEGSLKKINLNNDDSSVISTATKDGSRKVKLSISKKKKKDKVLSSEPSIPQKAIGSENTANSPMSVKVEKSMEKKDLKKKKLLNMSIKVKNDSSSKVKSFADNDDSSTSTLRESSGSKKLKLALPTRKKKKELISSQETNAKALADDERSVGSTSVTKKKKLNLSFKFKNDSSDKNTDVDNDKKAADNDKDIKKKKSLNFNIKTKSDEKKRKSFGKTSKESENKKETKSKNSASSTLSGKVINKIKVDGASFEKSVETTKKSSSIGDESSNSISIKKVGAAPSPANPSTNSRGKELPRSIVEAPQITKKRPRNSETYMMDKITPTKQQKKELQRSSNPSSGEPPKKVARVSKEKDASPLALAKGESSSSTPSSVAKKIIKIGKKVGENKDTLTSTSKPSTSSAGLKIRLGKPPSKSTSHPPSKSTSHPPSKSTSHPPSKSTSHPPSKSTSHPPSKLISHPPSKSTSHPPSKSTSHPPSKSTSHPPSKLILHPPLKSTSHPPSKSTSHPPSRGKELPKAVAVEESSSSKIAPLKSGSIVTISTKQGKDSKERTKRPILPLRASTNKGSSTVSASTNASKPISTATSSTTTAPASNTTTTSVTSITTTGPAMDHAKAAACSKVLSALRRREPMNSSWFMDAQTTLSSDPKLSEEYRSRIGEPIDLGRVASKLDKGKYSTVAEFVRDVRRIFGNCLRYNTDAESKLRVAAMRMLEVQEYVLKFFFSDIPLDEGDEGEVLPHYPELTYGWRRCLTLLSDILELKEANTANKENGRRQHPPLQIAHFFLHPVKVFYGGHWPPNYLSAISRPMDLGTLTSSLVEADCRSVADFVNDLDLIWKNCMSYNKPGGDDDADRSLKEKAATLQRTCREKVPALKEFCAAEEKNSVGNLSQTLTSTPCVINRPPKTLLLQMLNNLRLTTYTDKRSKLSESATSAFEQPVDTTIFTDYRDYVKHPMDFGTIESKIKKDEYRSPEDFEFDLILIFKNCEKYNIPKRNDLIVAKAKQCMTKFRKMYTAKIKNYLDSLKTGGKDRKVGGGATKKEVGSKKRPKSSSASTDGSGSKKMTKKPRISLSISSSSGDPKGTINLTPNEKGNASTSSEAMQKISSPALEEQRRKSTKSVGHKSTSAKRTKMFQKSEEHDFDDPNVPVDLPVAIQRVKECYQPRRSLKELEPWEVCCSNFFKSLMQHSWLRCNSRIPGSRPKFNYHAPVHMVYPEVRLAYEERIEHPMDLTTAEAKLLRGTYYSSPQDFVDDVALIFSNGINFNKKGHSEGDPIACSYYDASLHLLRYARWKSMDHFSAYLENDEEEVDVQKDKSLRKDSADDDSIYDKYKTAKDHHEQNRQQLYDEKNVPFTWKLSVSEKKKAREEMESMTMSVSMVKSEVGDTYTWMESECEKLLKALRRQTDTRFMTYFIAPQFPQDYAAYVSRPMSWDQCSSNLQGRRYSTLGEAVEDLRLIFSNARKYNARAKDTDTVSGRAYDAAVTMSGRLEVAVDNMLIHVADRLRRETVDRRTAEREEEERKYYASRDSVNRPNRQPVSKSGNGESSNSTTTTSTKTNVIMTVTNPKKKRTLDFNAPLLEEDERQRQERTAGEAQRRRRLLEAVERQPKDVAKRRKVVKQAGLLVYARLAARSNSKVSSSSSSGLSSSSSTTASVNNGGVGNSVDRPKVVLSLTPNPKKGLSLSFAKPPTDKRCKPKKSKTKARMAAHLILENF